MPFFCRVSKFIVSTTLLAMSAYWLLAFLVTGGVFLEFVGVTGVVGIFWLVVTMPILTGIIFWLQRRGSFGDCPHMSGLIVVFCGLCAHLFFLGCMQFFFHQSMVSDFSKAQLCLESGRIMTLHNPQFRHWCNYEVILSCLGEIITPRLLTGQVLNVICVAGTAYPVYRICERMSGNVVATIVASFLILYPTNILFETFLVQDFLAAMLTTWGVYMLLRLVDEQGRACLLVMTLGSAFCMALSQVLKPIIPIVLIALTIALSFGIGLCERGYAVLKRRVPYFLLFLLLFVLCVKCIAGLFFLGYDQKPAARKHHSILPWKSLLVGLDVKHGGVYSDDTPRIQALSPEQARADCIRAIKRDYSSYPILFLKKSLRLNCCDKWVCGWFGRTTGATVGERLRDVVFSGHYLLVAMIAWSVLCSTMRWFRRSVLDLGFCVSLGIMIGVMALLCVVELQGRYRTAVYPMYFIVMATGIQVLLESILKYRGRGT